MIFICWFSLTKGRQSMFLPEFYKQFLLASWEYLTALIISVLQRCWFSLTTAVGFL